PLPIDLTNVGAVRYAAREAEIGSYLAETCSDDAHAIEAVEAPFRELVTNLRQQISGLITDKANLSAVILRLTQDRLEAQQE
ncbi:hypothetical protein, partial [Enterobacter cloacae]|uniref:hypothetical protein n=1 Tax=Enterobacter cloacae TaxID=550 RepID=UPI001952C9A6